MSLLTVVVPAYNEEQMVPAASAVIGDILDKNELNYEIVFVDDGSADKTWDCIRKASEENHRVRGIHFSRNFGKEAAIMAGLAESQGDCTVVIDCDLQHPPEKILEMYRLWEQGYEIIEGVKSDRGKESRIHRFAAKKFYSLISAATGIDMSQASDFKLLDRKAVDVLVGLHEKNAFFRALSSWIGFRTTSVSFEVRDRMAGESKWSTKALTKYAVSNITSFSAVPMQAVTIMGVVMLLISIILGCVTLFQKISGASLEGFTTVIILQLFSSSMIMISLGIVGYYIARIFEEVKDRPIYIISSKCGESREVKEKNE